MTRAALMNNGTERNTINHSEGGQFILSHKWGGSTNLSLLFMYLFLHDCAMTHFSAPEIVGCKSNE